MEFAVELESRYQDYDSLKNAVKKDIELYEDFRTDYEGEDYSREAQALLNSGGLEPNFEAVEHVLNYMHENIGTSGEIAKNVSREVEDLKEDNVQMLVRDLEKKGFAQRYKVSPKMKDQTRIRQLTMLKDQESVQNYTEDKRLIEGHQSNAHVPFPSQRSNKAPWDDMLEEEV